MSSLLVGTLFSSWMVELDSVLHLCEFFSDEVGLRFEANIRYLIL